MKFRIIHQNTNLSSESSIKSFLVKDKRVDNGYKMCSLRTYKRHDVSDCYGNISFVEDLALLVMQKYIEDGAFSHSGEHELSAKGSDLVVIMNHLNLLNIFIEASHDGSDSWFPYSIYEKLADIENI